MGRTWMLVWAGLLLLPVPALAAFAPFEGARVIVSDAPTPPYDGAWQATEMPYFDPAEPDGPYSQWFRFPIDDQPVEAAYFWRHNMTISVWLNDELLFDGGSFEDPMTRYWNHPILLRLPASAYRSTDNYLYVRLGMYPGWGLMVPPTLGDFAPLHEEYRFRYLMQVGLNQSTAILSVVTGLLGLLLFFVIRSPEYGYFALVNFSFTPFILNNFVTEIPMSARAWWTIQHIGIDWYAAALVLFAHRLFGVSRPRVEILAGLFALSSLVLFLSLPMHLFLKVGNYMHVLAIVVAFYVLVLSATMFVRTRSVEGFGLLVCMSITVVFAAYDVAITSRAVPSLYEAPTYLSPIATPFFMATMFAVLSVRFFRNLRSELDAEQQLQEERRRIYSDIHDDVGSRLLSLIYSAESEKQESMARNVLREVRAVVRGAIVSNGSLLETLTGCEQEARERCTEAGIRIEWERAVTDDIKGSETLHYHVQRIMRELISNAIRHAGTDCIEVSVKAGTSLELRVRDYGESGFPENQGEPAGVGIISLERRVQLLSGNVEWKPASPGCEVQVRLPL